MTGTDEEEEKIHCVDCVTADVDSRSRSSTARSNPVYIDISGEKQHITAQISAAMESHGKEELKGPVLHIVVVGFHHKKGCQVEYSYPPLIPEEGHDSSNLPEEWKYLPFLALPDGAHNYQEDTVYFHLPPFSGADMKCVYGVSCYRQIEAKVDRADCPHSLTDECFSPLPPQPLYGLLQAKLQLITHAYFEEKDFSQISILKELYEHMNGSLRGTALEGSQVFLGKIVLIYGLTVCVSLCVCFLFQVLFYVSPVNRLVEALMTVLSLFPGMIEHGLADSSHYQPKSSVSDDISLLECVSGAEEFVSVSVTDITNATLELVGEEGFGENQTTPTSTEASQRTASSSDTSTPAGASTNLKPPSRTSPDSSESDWETLDPSVLEDIPKDSETGGLGLGAEHPETFDPEPGVPITVQPQGQSAGQGGQVAVTQGLVSGLEEDQYGLPLAIFTKGYLCLPYMALQQHHLLSDVTVRGFVAGATNILFRQQRHLSDAIVDVEEAKIQIGDPELRKLLSLTTADLRFADYLVKHVTENREDIFLDGTGWEGGDEWIRAQFGLYVHSLLSSTLQEDNEKLLADWGTPFISAWRITHNYRVWFSNKHPAMAKITPGHPFQGHYSAADLKLRFSHSVQNSERGKKIGAAVITTSRSVVQTGKAVGQSVGGVLTSAKSAMSSWFSTLAQPAILATPAASPEPQSPTEP
uniref:UDENN domain-containing protein n=1 Tax=Oncorhynchus mykiss TaxID=8022 RepID=A0A8C7S9P2_ONCMY